MTPDEKLQHVDNILAKYDSKKYYALNTILKRLTVDLSIIAFTLEETSKFLAKE